jgi:hypothetical protein
MSGEVTESHCYHTVAHQCPGARIVRSAGGCWTLEVKQVETGTGQIFPRPELKPRDGMATRSYPVIFFMHNITASSAIDYSYLHCDI